MDRFSDSERNRAIVMGGSMAGLLTAKVLAGHFNDVLLVERDALEDSLEFRRGVPQGHHTHVLLASGSRVLDSLFPGMSEELTEAGATSGDVGENVRWFLEGALLCRFASSIEGFGMSRPFLERIVRARVRNSSNLRIADRINVDNLSVSSDKKRIVGVRCGDQTFDADLIVDATGRGSRSPLWLEAIGYERPVEEKVGIELRYTTRLFSRCPNDLGGDNAFIIPPTPFGKRGGGIVSQEGARWIVTLMTHFGDYPPAELRGFVEFARSLPASDIYDVIRDAEPVGEAKSIRIAASVRHRYEHLKRFPAGYLVVGDAISSFNPIYGQGMSVAALEAAELDAVLRKPSLDLRRHFFRRAAKIVDGAWSISASNDLRMPEATGPRGIASTLTNWYVSKLLAAGNRHATPARAFLKVSNLLSPPLTLVQPPVLWRALLPRSFGLGKPNRIGK